jgi:sulfur-oxidizing protein SoxY
MRPQNLARRHSLRQAAALAGLFAAALLQVRPAHAAGAAAGRGAFNARSVADVYKSLGLASPIESAEVSITGPDIAENGSVGPFALASSAPDTKQILLLIEKNPGTLAALFNVTPEIEPQFATRVKMAESSIVYAVAVTGAGKVLFARKDVRVTLGGCGG